MFSFYVINNAFKNSAVFSCMLLVMLPPVHVRLLPTWNPEPTRDMELLMMMCTIGR
jgi:hypothetical protein